MDKRLNEIIKDKTSGSADLLIKLSELFRKNASDSEALKALLNDSENHFRSFEIINKYLKKVKKALRTGDKDLINAAVKTPLNNQNVYLTMYNNALPFIKSINRIFTFSNSRTIYEILKLHKKEHPRLKVFITESRPINEGRILAKKLLQEKVRVEFATDVSMAFFIQKCEAVFCGTDKILKDGRIVNKTGSLNAAVLAKYYNKPFYIFGESTKFSVQSPFINKPKDPAEVWKHMDERLKIQNLYFEIVPSELITKIFTES